MVVITLPAFGQLLFTLLALALLDLVGYVGFAASWMPQ